MKFIDKEHEMFYYEKMQELSKYCKSDCYYKSIIYCLAICEVTREHFNDIFNIANGEININSLQSAYQTGTSLKVTRAAFSLWNRCNYDSEQDLESGNVSENYNIGDIFCSSYAPYIYEAVKIRYPEYTKFSEEGEE